MLDDLKVLLHADPFTPFRIVLTSGGGFDVMSPFQVAVGASQLHYYYPKSDRKALLRLNQVAAFEVSDPPERSNGHK